ncbi:hypothetical protein [Corynebacterium mendelii]|uniref:hypothetical protein n=1 Tax=Corynebacterium mendelii TaxID=2765362 RepID=UPI00366A6C63
MSTYRGYDTTIATVTSHNDASNFTGQDHCSFVGTGMERNDARNSASSSCCRREADQLCEGFQFAETQTGPITSGWFAAGKISRRRWLMERCWRVWKQCGYRSIVRKMQRPANRGTAPSQAYSPVTGLTMGSA